MTKFTAEDARKLRREVNKQEEFYNNIKEASEKADSVVDSILEDIKKHICDKKENFIDINLGYINKMLCVVKTVQKLKDLGFILSSDSFNETLNLKISWNEKDRDIDGHGGLYAYLHVYVKNYCKFYKQSVSSFNL
jgi:hypothetical protein